MCNSWNHPPGCTCGWGGDGHRGSGGTGIGRGGALGGSVQISCATANPNVFSSTVGVSALLPHGYMNPNARCPVCNAPVYFFQSESGARVFFDDVGSPWPKHPCTDNPVAKKNTVLPCNEPVPKKPGAQKWRALKHVSIHHENGILSVRGVATDVGDERLFYFVGALALCGGYDFEKVVLIESTPPFNGVWKAVLLHRSPDTGLVFRDFSLYLEARDSKDIAAWEGALNGNPVEQNAVGWMLSFGRRKNRVFDDARLYGPIAKYWFDFSAQQNFWAGHHNLGMVLLDGLDGARDEQRAFVHLKEAARSLQPVSIKRYARCYRKGAGCVQDAEIADALELLASFESVLDEEC